MKFLIVNADDFGFSQEINAGVCEAHQRGVVTDASLLVRSPHARHALGLAKNAHLPVGLHIDFVTPYVQRTSPDFGPKSRLARELFNREFNQESPGEFTPQELLRIHDEMRGQIEDFRKMAGRLPSHLDYHFGLHYLPEVMAIYLPMAEQYRLPVRWGAQYAGGNPSVLAPARMCDRFRGVQVGGVEQFLDLLKEDWTGVLEMVCHPGYYTPVGVVDGYNMQREYELQTLTHPRLKAEIEQLGIQLVNYDWLNEHRGSDL